uniref:Uncharacterized protein n=1 Tax=Solanum tuberosum TaxID=4113 RepID=M1AK63_SOLTU
MGLEKQKNESMYTVIHISIYYDTGVKKGLKVQNCSNNLSQIPVQANSNWIWA